MTDETQRRFGDEERRLMHLVPAPAVKLMKSRVLSRPGMKKHINKAAVSWNSPTGSNPDRKKEIPEVPRFLFSNI